MKYLSSLLLTAAVFLVWPPIASADLVSYWSMDETEGDTAMDSVGSNHAVFLNPDVSLEWRPGRVGGAAKLTDSGGDDYFLIERIDEFIGSDAITIALWVDLEPQTSSPYNGIFMTRTINDQENNSWGLAVQNTHLDARANGPGLVAPPGSFVPDGGWYHIAMVWDGSEGSVRNYINGQETAATMDRFFGEISGTSGPWYIGYDDCCGGGRDLDGWVDEVAVWNEALDLTKISLLAQGARPDQLDALDLDEDGMPNEYEEGFDFLDPNDPADALMDEDDDGLNNLGEFLADTDPDGPDTDGDGLSDGDEVNTHGSNPKSTDTDGDSLADGVEVNTHMTDPRFADTDGDRIPDGEEITDGTDPTDPLSPVPPIPPDPGLIGLWRMDDLVGGIATDVVSGNDAVWQAGETDGLEWVDGVVGGAADLSDQGGNHYFQIDDLPELIGAQGITIAAWVSADPQGGYNGIFMTRTFNGATNNSWGIAYEADGRLDTRVNGPGIDSTDGAIAPEEGVWHHVVMVWNSEDSSHTQYLDGVRSSVGSGPDSEIVGPVSGPWYIGYDDCCGGGRDFDGRLDEIALWNQALSAGEVAEIYANGLAGIGITPGASFEIREITRSSEMSVELTWTSQPGQFFTVRTSPTMAPGSWTPVLSAVRADEGEVTSAMVGLDTAAANAFFQVLRVPAPATLSEDFEGAAEGWTTVDNGIVSETMWELGTPSEIGPAEANSGSRVFGTDLDAPYLPNVLGEGAKGIALRSPIIDLAGDTLVTLEFAYYLDLAPDEPGGGRINVLDAEGNLIEALEPLLIIDEVPEREWATFGPLRLSQAITDAGEIVVEFEFISAESGGEPGGGLYIDDVVVK
ncbi:MAG: LamG-like jellyroll fold domain-containing protein [Verrucomicrobiota bacterium]